MECRFDVIAEQSEEASDGESFIAVAEDLPVYGMPEVVVGDEGDNSIDGNHSEDTDDVLLLPRF